MFKSPAAYPKLFESYEKKLVHREWPLPEPGDGYFLDFGIDPSMSSSGLCGILRNGSQLITCRVLNHKTSPQTPTPLRLMSVPEVAREMLQELLASVPDGSRVHVTLLLEVPPTNLSSSAWLFALNQMLWMGFGPEEPVFQECCSRGIHMSFHQLAIGNTQLKQLYFRWSEKNKQGFKYNEIKKSKSTMVKVVRKTFENSQLENLLPKRYNNDVAEAIAMACCAGACSLTRSYTTPGPSPYNFLSQDGLFDLMVSKVVNKHNERMGWIYRPLENAFGWDSQEG